jgi:hypothetical protein
MGATSNSAAAEREARRSFGWRPHSDRRTLLTPMGASVVVFGDLSFPRKRVGEFGELTVDPGEHGGWPEGFDATDVSRRSRPRKRRSRHENARDVEARFVR